MIVRRKKTALLLAPIISMTICAACNKAPDTRSTAAASQANANSQASQTRAIETEVVTPQLIAGAVRATGKILVSEDRVAAIGPVHEGRLVRLYAGQGSVVRKGQKLADLQSADLDEAEADYLKAVADSENARRTSEE